MTPEEIREKAREIYNRNQCGAGCCGDFEGAMAFVMEQIEDIQTATFTRGVEAAQEAAYFDKW